MLTIFIDFKSPASYLALEPTIALIEETGVETKWLPFSTRPFNIPPEKSDETVGERHRRVRARAQRDTHLFYAKALGREMRFPDPMPGSEAALAALAAYDGNPLEFIQAAFAAYWVRGADLDDEAVVSALLAEVGADTAGFAKAREKLAAIQSAAMESGVIDAPAYVIDEQLFVGREHLPWIGEIIAANRAR